jgi:septal ring factor EnvC (AmiA/AmiB activator)
MNYTINSPKPSIPEFTTEQPDWGARRPTGTHGNWTRIAKGIECKADATQALVYKFEGFPDRILANDEHHAFSEITTTNLKALEARLRDARWEVDRLEEELGEAEDEVETLRQQIRAIRATTTAKPQEPFSLFATATN